MAEPKKFRDLNNWEEKLYEDECEDYKFDHEKEFKTIEVKKPKSKIKLH